MAALDGKITIEKELRPCIVHIPSETRVLRKNKEGRFQETKSEGQDLKALFHCWDHRSELYGASPMIGSHPGGQVSGTFAIVEYEDGTVHEVKPQNIRFVDNAMCEYVFPEGKGEKEKAFDVLRGICPECGGNMRFDKTIVLKGLSLLYAYKCNNCGHIEYSGSGRV